MSQHMMVLGLNPRTGTKEVSANPLAVPTEGRTKAQISYDIARTIYVRDGFRGFYRGYVASLCTYVPSSACWWTFYSSYQVRYYNRSSVKMIIMMTFQMFGAALAPVWAPATLVQCVAAVASGGTH